MNSTAPSFSPQLTIQPRNFAAEDPGGWETTISTAIAADRAGVDRIIVSDHVAFGENLDAYSDPTKGGTAGGRQPTGPDGHWLEPLTLLTFLGAKTSRVRLGTAILLAALRRPAVLAKTAATMDVLTGGRIDLGVGVGWQAEEYEACGVPFAERGPALDETLEICQLLWTQPSASYRSANLAFNSIHQMPKPVQAGGVPLWISGTVNPRSMKRLARFGTGWIPWGPAIADPVGGIQSMRSTMEDLGRDPATIQVTAYIPTQKDADGGIDLAGSMAAVPAMNHAGITDFKLTIPIPPDLDEATEVLSSAVDAFQRSL